MAADLVEAVVVGLGKAGDAHALSANASGQRPHIEAVIAAELVDRNATPGGFTETRSEEHTSELQSLMRNSYAVLCLQTKTPKKNIQHQIPHMISHHHS